MDILIYLTISVLFLLRMIQSWLNQSKNQILIIKHEQSDTIGTVKWYQEDYTGWCVDNMVIDEQQFTDEMWDECKVIGNIFDNADLLEEDK